MAEFVFERLWWKGKAEHGERERSEYRVIIYIYIDYFTPFVLLDILFLFLVNLYPNQQDFTFYFLLFTIFRPLYIKLLNSIHIWAQFIIQWEIPKTSRTRTLVQIIIVLRSTLDPSYYGPWACNGHTNGDHL